MADKKLFAKTPESFSGYSHVTGIELNERSGGLIFDSLESLKHALKVYNGEVSISRATSSNLIRDVDQAFGGDAGLLVGMGMAKRTEKDPALDIRLYPPRNSRFAVKNEDVALLREARNSLARYLPR